MSDNVDEDAVDEMSRRPQKRKPIGDETATPLLVA
jgi:hypothetical protein